MSLVENVDYNRNCNISYAQFHCMIEVNQEQFYYENIWGLKNVQTKFYFKTGPSVELKIPLE